ncbi:phosphoglycerate mutase family protein [Phenylobacterium zucineum HLK1]|uniref:Phosphoglycerate mutase family protein n=1 Tax=Phenylobacterium zucineum (strain HLK1) TaxID=450851 RepID=B4R9L5_PHEZH|nr:histidine phosphatase family protein [Phenylobacterium zucineum]ACG79475.1 phosphoglycerate mutase family protein [Phenylobacterium zucineum HLK1]
MILLLRHGETHWNVERRIQGRRESALTPRGERQAAAMGRLVADLIRMEPPADWRLAASPLLRAQATAQAVAARAGLRIDTDERLAEICCGDWEGKLRSEVGAGGPEWFFGAPGGETFEEVMARVESFLADLPPEPRRRMVVVSHGVTGRLLRGAYAGLPRAETLAQDVPQDAVYRLAGGQVDRFDCEPID